MKNKLMLSILSSVILIQSMQIASAHCPLCTAGAAVGVGTARYFGINDSIVGLFLGAFIVSMALWFNKWLLKKNINFKFQELILVILSFLLLVIPLYLAGIIIDFEMVKSMPEYSMLGMGIYGIDKLLLGMIIGSLAVWGVFSLSDVIKKKRGKILYPYQGISFMFIILAILSLAFWLITK